MAAPELKLADILPEAYVLIVGRLGEGGITTLEQLIGGSSRDLHQLLGWSSEVRQCMLQYGY